MGETARLLVQACLISCTDLPCGVVAAGWMIWRNEVFGGVDTCAAEHDDGRTDALCAQLVFRFEQFQLQPQWAQVILGKEFDVLLRKSIGRAVEDCLLQAFALVTIDHLGTPKR